MTGGIYVEVEGIVQGRSSASGSLAVGREDDDENES
jgi:hypothetical protein